MTSRRPIMAYRLLLLALVATLGPIACTKNTSDRDLVYLDPAEALEVTSKSGGLLGFRKPKTVRWVDTRPPAAFELEHIPDAINVPYRDLEEALPELRDFAIIVVYGQDFADIIPNAMSKSLIENGVADVRILRGGMRAWTRAGNDTEGIEASG